MAKKYIRIILALAIIGVCGFLGYVYYAKVASGNKTPPNPSIIAPQNPNNKEQSSPHSESNESISHTATTLPVLSQDYQPTESERLFYRLVIEALVPKPLPDPLGIGIDGSGIGWSRPTYRAFPQRESYIPHIDMSLESYYEKHPDERYSRVSDPFMETLRESKKEAEDSAFLIRQFYQGMISNLQEFTKQFPDSPYFRHYQETIELIRQMQKEDDEFYDKYHINKVSLTWTDIHYRGTLENQSSVPLEERIKGYIFCLRYSYFHKEKRYRMEWGLGDGIVSYDTHCKDPILSGAKLAGMGVPVVSSVLNLLGDRRPIIAVSEPDVIPATFYRYSDAAVEILQRMFGVKKPFPIQIPEDQYFSQYLEQQTPEDRQTILESIKEWVKECTTETPLAPKPSEEPTDEQK